MLLAIILSTPALVPPPSVIVGGGPAGLAAAIMLARKGCPSIKVLDRLPPPAAVDNEEVWSDTARHYLVGLGGRGQNALKAIDCWDNVVEPFCATVVGRKDWSPGASMDEGVERIFTDRPYLTRVIPRDRMVSCLYEHAKSAYGGAIEIQHGIEVADVRWETTDSDEQRAVITCEPCGAESEAEECEADGAAGRFELSTELLIGADGTRRTIANAMETDDASRPGLLAPFRRFKVKRFVDTSVRVYKTVPLDFPKKWRRDINYSCRTSSINFDALPTLDGKYCGVLLIKPDDAAAQSLPDVPAARKYMEELLPQFSDSITDEALAQVIAKPPSRLPVFRYVGPHLHRGSSTVLLGDAIHSVKPYFGLGVNSAFEDVEVLSQALDGEVGGKAGGKDADVSLGDALDAYSRKRAPEARALVELSRSFDRSGLLAFFTFILPLILDGIFHGALPKIFAPNTLAMLQRVDVTFRQIRWRKRFDRLAQVLILGAAGTVISKAAIAVVRLAARVLLSTVSVSALPGPRWLLPAVLPLAAALGAAIRMRLKVGGDVADVLAAQTEGQAGLGAVAEEPEPIPAEA